MSKARTTPCARFSRSTAIRIASPAVGAGARIGLAIAGPQSARGTLLQACRDLVAERWARPRHIVSRRQFVQLRHLWDLDPGSGRRWRQRDGRRCAGRNDLRGYGTCVQRESGNQTGCEQEALHGGYVGMRQAHRKRDYSSGACSIGSNRSASRPSRFHDCSICGGNGAVASMTPPRGWGITIRRAKR